MMLRPFLDRTPAVLKDRAGRTYVLPSYAEPIAQHIFTYGAYEPDTRDAVLAFLPKSGTFIDVGANIGALSIPIACMRPDASIICVEADPDISRLLRSNVSGNSCKAIRVIACVAGNADNKYVSFYPAPKEKFGMGSLGPQFGGAPIKLKQMTLDTLLREANVCDVDVIKIDVEGAELAVLQGAPRLFASRRKPVVVFEFADWAEARITGQAPGDAQRALLANGYRLFYLTSGGRAGDELLEPRCTGTAMLLGLPGHMSLPARR
jgi:FkbM family methyltransferase